MDLSNRQTAENWHKRAEEVADKDLRRAALATCEKYTKLAIREERLRLKMLKPGYGIKSMFGWIMLVTMAVLLGLLALGKEFSIVTVCSVFTVVLVLCVVAAAVTLKVYGKVSEDGMLAMIQMAFKAIGKSSETGSVLKTTAAASVVEAGSPTRRLPSTAPEISFDHDKPSDSEESQ